MENEDYYESSPERIGENSIQLAQGNKEVRSPENRVILQDLLFTRNFC